MNTCSYFSGLVQEFRYVLLYFLVMIYYEIDKVQKVKNTRMYTSSPHSPRVHLVPLQHARDFTIVRMIIQPIHTNGEAYYLTYRETKDS